MLNWWSNYSAEHFKEQSQCMVQQYGNFNWKLAGGQNVSGHRSETNAMFNSLFRLQRRECYNRVCVIAGQWNKHFRGEHCRQWRRPSSLQGAFYLGLNWWGSTDTSLYTVLLSFQAYLKWVETEGEEARLPGLDLDHKQLFFLNFAQVRL